MRALENAARRVRLNRRAEGCKRDVADDHDFRQMMAGRCGLGPELVGGGPDDVPKSGLMIAIANHSFCILDGLMLGCVLGIAPGDFRIVVRRVFRKAEDLAGAVLPISFDETPETARRKAATRKTALDYLAEGVAIGIFPGGTVSTAPKPFTRSPDPVWRGFTAKLVAKSGATAVPFFFCGCNSRLLQIASHLRYKLRVALLLNKFRTRADEPDEVVVGEPIPQEMIDTFGCNSRSAMDFHQRKTRPLGPGSLDADTGGFEFNDRYRS